MLDIFTGVIEQFGTFFQLRDKLTVLSNSSPVAATVLIFIMTMIAANTIFTQAVEFKRKFLGEWIRNPFAWVGLVLGAVMAGLISTGVVLNLRKASAPVPALVVDTDTVIGRPLLLSWKYDNADKERSVVRFEVQSSTDPRFDQPLEYGYRSGRSALIGSVNSKRYWRIRAIDEDSSAISTWSHPVLITQYENSLRRILDTHSINIYISNALNEGLFEFEAKDNKGTLKGYDVAVINHIVSRLPAQLGIDGPINFNPLLVDWEELLVAPKNGRADIIISAITASSEREDTLSVKFSNPYYCTTQSLIYRPGQAVMPIAKMIENKRVGVMVKTTSADLIEKFQNDPSARGKFTIVPYDEGDLMIAAFAKNEIDLGLTDTPLARAAELSYGTEMLNFKELVKEEDFPKGLDPARKSEKYGIAVRAGETKLVEAINRVIDEMRNEMLGKFLEQATEEFHQIQHAPGDAPIDRRKDPSQCGSG